MYSKTLTKNIAYKTSNIDSFTDMFSSQMGNCNFIR